MSTISRDVARRLAAEELAELFEGTAVDIIDDRTLENDIGWVFFYEARAFLTGEAFSDELLGNAPVLVRSDGLVVLTGTAFPVEDYVAIWRHAARPEAS